MNFTCLASHPVTQSSCLHSQMTVCEEALDQSKGPASTDTPELWRSGSCRSWVAASLAFSHPRTQVVSEKALSQHCRRFVDDCVAIGNDRERIVWGGSSLEP